MAKKRNSTGKDGRHLAGLWLTRTDGLGQGRSMMDRLPDPNGLQDAALYYADLGFRCIPLAPGAKAPPLVKWGAYREVAPTDDQYRDWFADTRRNIAVLTGDVIVADVDDPELLDFVMEKCGRTDVISRTPSGGYHLWYRRRQGTAIGNRVDVRGHELDLRGQGGYAIVAPSRTPDGTYEWLGGGLRPCASLPLFKVSWTRERVRRTLRPVAIDLDGDVMVRRARAYLATIEGAVSGQRGHDRTMRVAGVLVQKFGLTIDKAWPLFLEWNEQCEPPWSERELRHKLEDAERLKGTAKALR